MAEDESSITGQFQSLSPTYAAATQRTAAPAPAAAVTARAATAPAAAAAATTVVNGAAAGGLDASQAVSVAQVVNPATAAPGVQTATSAPKSSTTSAAAGASAASSATANASTQPPALPPSQAEIQAAVARANANLANSGRSLDFSVDRTTGITIAIIRNTKTGAVLQQIPGADVIALARMLADWSPGNHTLLDLFA